MLIRNPRWPPMQNVVFSSVDYNTIEKSTFLKMAKMVISAIVTIADMTILARGDND
jgi:hypothetical protein